MKPLFRHHLLANLRDFRVLFREFRVTLMLFAVLIAVGSLVLHCYYRDPVTGMPLGMVEALYAMFSLIFVEATIPFPRVWFLQALFFLTPILGLGILGEGIVRFGILLFNKNSRWEEWQVALASTYANHVIVCGVGRLGYRIIQQLLECGEEVVAVERDKQDPFLEKIRVQHVPVILANACEPEALRQAGVTRARSIIPCTEDDLTNLEIALNAEEANPRIKVVLRMFEPELAKKVEKGFGFHTALSTSALAAPAFAAAATQTGVMHAFSVDHTMLYVAQTAVPANSTLIGQTVSQLERAFDLSVILHQRKAKVDLHPGPETVLQDGDRLVLFATLDVLSRFRKQYFDR